MKKGIIIASGAILLIIFAIFVSIFLFSYFIDCKGMPSVKDVKQEFLIEFPSAKVITINTFASDCAAVYFDIKYQLPDERKVMEKNWQYINRDEGKWEKRDITQ